MVSGGEETEGCRIEVSHHHEERQDEADLAEDGD